MDASNLKPEHGVIAAIASAIGTIAGRLLPRRQLAAGPTKRERELEEKLLDARFQAVEDRLGAKVASLEKQLADVLRENGRQAQQLLIAEKDINNLWRRERGEKSE